MSEVVVTGGTPLVAADPTPGRAFGDVEGPIRTWVQGLDIAGQRVYFERPRSGPLPWIVLARIAGVPHDYVALDVPRITFDVYGASKALAAVAAYSLVTAIETVPAGTPMGALVCMGASVELGPVWTPDQAAQPHPRYTVDALFRLRPA